MPSNLQMQSGRAQPQEPGGSQSVADGPSTAGLRGPHPRLPAILEAEVGMLQGTEPALTQGKETSLGGPLLAFLAESLLHGLHVGNPTSGHSPACPQSCLANWPRAGTQGRCLRPGRAQRWVNRQERRDGLSVRVPPDEAHALRQATHRPARPAPQETDVRNHRDEVGTGNLGGRGCGCRLNGRGCRELQIHQPRALQRLKM